MYTYIFSYSIHRERRKKSEHVQLRRNENNVCKVGQSNETTILAAMASTQRKEEERTMLSLFPFCRSCFSVLFVSHSVAAIIFFHAFKFFGQKKYSFCEAYTNMYRVHIKIESKITLAECLYAILLLLLLFFSSTLSMN